MGRSQKECRELPGKCHGIVRKFHNVWRMVTLYVVVIKYNFYVLQFLFDGKSGKAETTIFWPYYSGQCRTVGTYSPRRNHGRATASRQTKKTVDTQH